MMLSAEEHLPFSFVVKEEPWGKHWAAPAFAAHLRMASEGRPPSELPLAAHEPFRVAVAAARAELGENARAKVQSVAYAAFMKAKFNPDIDSALANKFAVLFGLPACVPFGGVLRASIAKLSPQCASFALRTLANAWPTAHRMHSEPLPCLFGCSHDGSLDSLTHYIDCMPLHDAIFRALGHSQAPTAAHERVGLFPPMRADACLCAVACDVYLTWKGLVQETTFGVVAGVRLRGLAATIVRKHKPSLTAYYGLRRASSSMTD
jgi:hypothetical protein